jgi:cardiolipin synthase
MKAGHYWTEEAIYHEGDRFFSDLAHALAAARASVDLETYIFDRDELGQQVLHELAAASRRGVRVRLLLDGFGCANWTYQDQEELEHAKIDVKFYHPLPWQNSNYSFWRFLTPRRTMLGLSKLNRRNHRKTCVIDGELAFLGGMNVSARHLTRSAGAQAWRDTSVRVRGEALHQLTRAFDHAWIHARSASLRGVNDPRFLIRSKLLRLNLNRKMRAALYEDLIHHMLHARKRIWITNPYFIPERALIRALRFAGWAGIDVRVLVPKRGDVWGLKWAIKAFYYILLTAKVRIYEYSPSVLHAKVMMIDDWAMVGSSNLNHRSLLHDLEVDVILVRPESLRSLEAQFLRDLSQSVEIDAHSWSQRPWIARALERLALLFRRWL